MVSAIVKTVELAQVAGKLGTISKVAQITQNLSRIAEVSSFSKVFISAAGLNQLQAVNRQINTLDDLTSLQGIAVSTENGNLSIVSRSEAGLRTRIVDGTVDSAELAQLLDDVQSTKNIINSIGKTLDEAKSAVGPNLANKAAAVDKED